jgi:hypothetical protein
MFVVVPVIAEQLGALLPAGGSGGSLDPQLTQAQIQG